MSVRREIIREADPAHGKPPTLTRGYLSCAEADRLLRWCLESAPWRGETLRLYGRSIPVPRQVCWFGDAGTNYRYSGKDHPAQGWPATLAPVARALQSNHVLLNRYADGADHMGWHADDERGVNGDVMILSLGAERRLRWRDPSGSHGVDLPHGSLLALDGCLPHTLTRTQRQVDVRVSLSFRSLQP